MSKQVMQYQLGKAIFKRTVTGCYFWKTGSNTGVEANISELLDMGATPLPSTEEVCQVCGQPHKPYVPMTECQKQEAIELARRVSGTEEIELLEELSSEIIYKITNDEANRIVGAERLTAIICGQNKAINQLSKRVRELEAK